ncbi:MAG: adenylyl cyclase, partial [Proteobacteria bacterium]|nr:adenylyl cyclase [Pseudomonadota bacterium]
MLTKMAGFLSELKRRNVIRVAIAYIIVAWLILQVVDVIVPILSVPDWVGKFVLLLLGIGLPVALLFAWAFELTPDGLKREKNVPREESIANRTGRKLDKIIIVTLVGALGVSLFLNFSGSMHQKPEITSAANEDDLSIAVLPFANRSADKADAYFVDGVHDELLTQL